MTQPKNVIGIDLMNKLDCGEAIPAEAALAAMKGFDALENILRCTTIGEIIYWNTPGCFEITLQNISDRNGFDVEFPDPEQEQWIWRGQTLHELLCTVWTQIQELDRKENGPIG